MASAGTDQTDITYVRPGTWQASAANVPGIDALHSFAEDPRLPQGPPDSSPGRIPTRGPSAVKDTKAPPQNARRWWQRKNASNIELDQQGNGPDWTVTISEDQHDTQKAPDPRWKAQVAPRWTARTGPVGVAYLNRISERGRGARRFVDNGGANFAFTPSLRPSPMSLGDGRPNIPRFRPTQRVSPASLDQQIVSQDQTNTESGGVLASGGTLSQRWW
jgi:hypothetical protein